MDRWDTFVDPETGYEYLFNPQTRQSRWLWSEMKDPSTGKTFFKNLKTGEVRWGEGHSGKTRGGKVGGGKVQSASIDDEELRRKLGLLSVEELHRGPQGKYYAYNKDTQKSRWLSKPKDLSKTVIVVERTAKKLQGLWRGYITRKRLEKLRTSTQLVEALRLRYHLPMIQDAVEKLKNKSTLTDADRTAAKKHVDHLKICGELVTQELLRVDGIKSDGNEVVRWKRKNTVKTLMAFADLVDELKHDLSKKLHSSSPQIT